MTLEQELKHMANGDLYYQTPELLELRFKVRDLLYQYNRLNYRDLSGRKQLLSKIFKHIGHHCFVEIPFHIDYGINTTLGENFFANNNLTILDAAPVTIGNDVLIAPNVGIYTAGHALDPQVRRKTGAEFGLPVTIGNNVWLGCYGDSRSDNWRKQRHWCRIGCYQGHSGQRLSLWGSRKSYPKTRTN
mgnify:CR=1 FL=1